MNDVIDELIEHGDLVDLSSDAELPIGQRGIIQLDGDFTLSRATEIGSIVAVFMPTLMSQAVAGRQELELNDEVKADLLGQLLMDKKLAEGVLHVYDIDSDVPDVKIVVLADPAHLFGPHGMEDLEGERTLLGTVDRLVTDGSIYSLERHFLPGMNRTIRRHLKTQGGLAGMIESFSSLMGSDIDPSVLGVPGPALIATAVAVY